MADLGDLVAWSPAGGPPDRGDADGTLSGDGKLSVVVGRRAVPLAMHDHVAAELLAVLDIDRAVARPVVRHGDRGMMEL